jgi:molybdate transport system substrate-binding protein
MRARWSWLAIFSLVGSACSAGSAGPLRQEIAVFAASSLTSAFEELAAEFESRNAGAVVVLNYAGSSQLAAQLAEGVPADVFASADPVQMQAVVDAGRIESGSESIFVTNRLTIIVPIGNPAGIEALEDLSRPGIALILAVEGVPVREYTDEILAAMPADFRAGFYANLVSEEDNVRQVAAKVALGEADAGIVYTSDVTADIAGQVLQIAIPDDLNILAAYTIAPLADSAHPEIARRFIEFVQSAEGQAILSRWGFGPLPGD